MIHTELWCKEADKGLEEFEELRRIKMDAAEAYARELSRKGKLKDLSYNTLMSLAMMGALRGANLRGFDQRKMSLSYYGYGEDALNIGSALQFRGMDLRGVDFTDALLRTTDFSGSDLSGANFQGAKLANCNFYFANLEGANFRGADMAHVNFYGSNLRGVSLEEAMNWRSAKGLEGARNYEEPLEDS